MTLSKIIRFLRISGKLDQFSHTQIARKDYLQLFIFASGPEIFSQKDTAKKVSKCFKKYTRARSSHLKLHKKTFGV